MKRTATNLAVILGAAMTFSGAALALAQENKIPVVDKLMAHQDRARSGWNASEHRLTPASVASGFGPVWSSPQLDSAGDVPPRMFSVPLFLHSVRMTSGPSRGRAVDATFVSTTAGYAYAISTAASGNLAPGTILWRTRLTDAPCNKGMMGNYGTGILDPRTNRFYVTSCRNPTGENGKNMWRVHALDLRSGKELSGWPIDISQTMIDNPSLNRNGTRTWKMGPGYRYVQRGALTLSEDGRRLYLAFGADAVGWMTVVDTTQRKLVSAFSATPNDEENGGGMWAQGGPALDERGRIYMTTGSNLMDGIKLGFNSMHQDTPHSWSHSILQFEDDRQEGLKLVGTYTPYNYCQAGKADIDIGSSPPIVVDLPAGVSKTTSLLVLGGGKQGNIYLLDRNAMPGSVTKRQACSLDPETDTSLLAPEPQPEWRRRAPINLFKPFSDEIGAYDQAKSRTSASYYRDESGTTHIYVTGSSKKGENFNTSTPPGLAKVKVVTSPDAPAHLAVDKLEMTHTFHNPSSPIITSNGGRDAILWMMDQGAPRTANLWSPTPPKPTLYAFDATDLSLIWKSEPGELYTTGNYGEPTIVNGLVLVGSDRIQAYGLRSK